MFKGIVLTFVFVFVVGLFSTIKDVSASEGLIPMRSLTDDTYRCYSTSILMQDFNYLVSVTCRDLIYPANDSILYYVLWATPVGGGSPVRLAELGLGRISFKTKTQFRNLFVTIENNPKARTPSKEVVIKGDLETISFLERPTSITITQAPSDLSPTQSELTPTSAEQNEKVDEKVSSKDKLFVAMQRAGIVAGVVLVILVGVIFAVSRARG